MGKNREESQDAWNGDGYGWKVGILSSKWLRIDAGEPVLDYAERQRMGHLPRFDG
jgi:hypothetical protein